MKKLFPNRHRATAIPDSQALVTQPVVLQALVAYTLAGPKEKCLGTSIGCLPGQPFQPWFVLGLVYPEVDLSQDRPGHFIEIDDIPGQLQCCFIDTTVSNSGR